MNKAVPAPQETRTSGLAKSRIPSARPVWHGPRGACSGMQRDDGGAERAGRPCSVQPTLGHHAHAVHVRHNHHRWHDGAPILCSRKTMDMAVHPCWHVFMKITGRSQPCRRGEVLSVLLHGVRRVLQERYLPALQPAFHAGCLSCLRHVAPRNSARNARGSPDRSGCHTHAQVKREWTYGFVSDTSNVIYLQACSPALLLACRNQQCKQQRSTVQASSASLTQGLRKARMSAPARQLSAFLCHCPDLGICGVSPCPTCTKLRCCCGAWRTTGVHALSEWQCLIRLPLPPRRCPPTSGAASSGYGTLQNMTRTS